MSLHAALLLTSSCLARTTVPAPQATGEALELVRGKWFDGEGFVEKTMHVVAGVFVESAPAAATQRVDLAGGYVVPPFGEAHNHNVHDGADAALARYLREGVFYVANPNSLPRQTTTIRARVNRPDAIDATFSGGGLTCSGGHPVELFEANLGRGIWRAEDGDGAFFHLVDDLAALEREWPRVSAVERDFLKTFLLYSEEHARRAADPASRGWRGLDPTLLPEIVRRSHQAGWRVSCHVETGRDFHHAVVAGVDEVAHMPGFRVLEGYAPETYSIAEEDARRAGERRLVVVTTLGGLIRHVEALADGDPSRVEGEALLDVARANLERLARHGARIAIGSDEYDLNEGTVVDEYLALERLGGLPPEQLLRAWCETTPQAIFPARKLGRLEPGYEASLIVLGGDPLADPASLRDIRRRMKQGCWLE